MVGVCRWGKKCFYKQRNACRFLHLEDVPDDIQFIKQNQRNIAGVLLFIRSEITKQSRLFERMLKNNDSFPVHPDGIGNPGVPWPEGERAILQRILDEGKYLTPESGYAQVHLGDHSK